MREAAGDNHFGISEQRKRFPYVNMWDRAGAFPRVGWLLSEHNSVQEGLQAYLECRAKLCRDTMAKPYFRKCISCKKRLDVTAIVSVAPKLLIVRLCPPYPPRGPVIPNSVRPGQLDKIVIFGECTYHLRNIIYLEGDHDKYSNFECGGESAPTEEVEVNAEVLIYSRVG